MWKFKQAKSNEIIYKSMLEEIMFYRLYHFSLVLFSIAISDVSLKSLYFIFPFP